jgi:pimeloyl-ACP methyl ester carboxylesterase
MQQDAITLANGREQIVYRGGDGPPLLWLHALSGVEPDHPLLAVLLERYSVIAPLAPGFNDLAELDEIRDIHDLAIHYEDILDAVGVDQAIVVGHSFGAMIAAELAAHFPRRVQRLVLISPIGLWNDAYPVADIFAVTYAQMPSLLYLDGGAARNGAAAANEAKKAADWIEAANQERQEEEVEALVELAKGMTTVAKFLWPIPDRGLDRRLYRITAPTAVVFGESDAFVPSRYGDDFVAALPDGELHVIAEAAHMVPVERPEEVAGIVLEFLRPAQAAVV